MRKSTLRIFTFIVVIILIVVTGCKKSSTESKNSPPVISSITISPASVPASGLASVTITATDSDGESLLYSSSVDGGTLVGGSEGSKLWIAPNSVGTYTFTVTVSDGSGGETTDTATLTVTDPITQITVVAQFEGFTGGDLSNSEGRLFYSNINWDFWEVDDTFDVMAIGRIGYFTITDIDAGSYWLEIWDDRDNNNKINAGDYWGAYNHIDYLNIFNGAEIKVSDGETMLCEITMYVFPL